MSSDTYSFISDPGHGWLQVPMSELEELGIASEVSRSSRRSGTVAYLEEDRDAELFVSAKIRACPSWDVNHNVTYSHAELPSRIRDLPPYSPPAGSVPSENGGPEIAC